MHHSLLLELQDESKGENVEIEAYFSFKKNSVATPAETTPTLENFSPAAFTPERLAYQL
jgi:hypothetical protein